MSDALSRARQYLQRNHPNIPVPRVSYLIFTSARSGSNLLCSHLESIGFGNPVEAFTINRNSRESFGWGIDFSDPAVYLGKAIEYQSVNGVMGVTFKPNQFENFLKTARVLVKPAGGELSDAEILDLFFPGAYIIYLQRKDIVKEAISFAKALQNGIWKESVEEIENFQEYVLPPVYDREHIECCFDILLTDSIYWRQFLAKNHLEFLKVWYEDLAGNYIEKMTEIYQFLGVKKSEIKAPALRKLSNKDSKKWEERFVRETHWFQAPNFERAYQQGEFEEMYTIRCRMVIAEKEQKRWSRMLAVRLKKPRTILFRIKRKVRSYIHNK